MANSKRKCTGCGDRFIAEEMLKLPAGYFHSIDCATTYAQDKQRNTRERQLAKAKRLRQEDEKAARRQHREKKAALKTLHDHIKEAQTAVNKYVRARDFGMPCISCGSLPAQKLGGTMDAGHYRSRGAAGHLRFNLHNIHAQCVSCNRYKSGNAVDYRISLIKRIGLEKVEALENDNASRKFTADYLQRVKRIFNKKARNKHKQKNLPKK